MKKIILGICDNSSLIEKSGGKLVDTNICKLMVIDTETQEDDMEIPIITFKPGSRTLVSQQLITDLLSPENQKYLLVLTSEESIADEKVITKNSKSIRIKPSNLKYELTIQERIIMEDLVCGCRNKEIAEKRKISAHTVKNHISSILSKLSAKDRTEAVRMWVSQN